MDDTDPAFQFIEGKFNEAALEFHNATQGYQYLPHVESMTAGFMEVNEVLTNMLAKRVYMSAMMMSIRDSV
ncbi:hypothetical protein [Amycolatopsis sp. lyj-108]|uniref:hypothetical protein n=1 Tax=Amycolatopsis sp. lyj-108 TaxID=2789286 RepID=UPI00397AB74F